MPRAEATIGFRTKLGKAIAIALSDRESPQFARRWTVELWDREIPETGQPHHELLERPWTDAVREVRRFETAIEDVTTERVRALVQELRADDLRVTSIGIVGAPDRDLERLGNRHIRAHAAEAMLFRRAVEVAAKRCRLPVRLYSDRGFETPKTLHNALNIIGRAAGRPWRVDERAAATASWLALTT